MPTRSQKSSPAEPPLGEPVPKVPETVGPPWVGASGTGLHAAGAADHRPSWSPRGSQRRAEPAWRKAEASSQADKRGLMRRAPLPQVPWGLKQHPRAEATA